MFQASNRGIARMQVFEKASAGMTGTNLPVLPIRTPATGGYFSKPIPRIHCAQHSGQSSVPGVPLARPRPWRPERKMCNSAGTLFCRKAR